MKTVRMRELVELVSQIYRTELQEIKDLKQQMYLTDIELGEAERTKGKDITMAKYNELLKRKEFLQKEIARKTEHSQGIFDARDILLDFGFDAEVSE